MKYSFVLFLIVMTFLESQAQKEDYQWMSNLWSIDDCSQSNFPENCNASILDFNTDPPTVYREPSATLDMDWTHASICDNDGQLLLYSNGMSIHGSNHTPIIDGDTISFGPNWAKNTWLNENNEIRSRGFLGVNCSVFVPVPDYKNRYYLIYYNFDDFFVNDGIRKLYAEIEVTNNEPRIIRKDVVLANSISEAGYTSCAQHANGRDWWLLQFSRDTVFSYLIDPSGINLSHSSVLPFEIRNAQTSVVFDDKAEKFAAHQIYQSGEPDGAELVIFDFDRCSGNLSNPLSTSLPSFDHFGSPGIAFSASGQYLYINDFFNFLQYDVWSDDVFPSVDTVMIYNGQAFYDPSGNILGPSLFGLTQKGQTTRYMSVK